MYTSPSHVHHLIGLAGFPNSARVRFGAVERGGYVAVLAFAIDILTI